MPMESPRPLSAPEDLANPVSERILMRALMEHLPDRIYFKDLQSRFIAGSRSFVELFGRDDFAQIQGRTDFDFFSEEHARAALEDEQEIIRTGRPKLTMEEKETWPDGRISWCCTSKSPLRDDQGRIIGTFGISKDITIEKQAQEALQASEAFLQTLINTIPLPVYYKDLDGRYLGFNKAYEEFFGDTYEELLGKTLFDIRSASLAESFRANDVELLASRGVNQLEAKVETKHRGERDVLFNKAVFTDSQGTAMGLIGTVLDLTEIKKLENQLHHSQKMEAIGTLAGGVAHDFNNILTAIIGFASLTRMKMRPEDPNLGAIDQILASSERAGQLTRSLLAFSRKQVISLKPVNLDTAILDVEKLLRRLIGENIELTSRVLAPGLVILADASQIGQVLINLVTNARDAMPGGGVIEIVTQAAELDSNFVSTHGFGSQGKFALITVSDNGTGMDKQTQSRIFEPFFTTKELGRGTGLGLAIVYAMIKQHNGFILVYSEPGLGTTFKIYVPLPFPILDRKQRVLDQIRAYLEDQDAYDRGMDEVPALMASGLTQEQIAMRLGTSVRPVRERLLRSGYNGKVVMFTPEDILEMKRLHESGLTARQIHAAIGKATEQAVRYRLQTMSCLCKTKHAHTHNPMTAEILRLHQTGIPAFRIADQVHMGRTLVCKILRQEGISLCRGSALKLPPDRMEWAEAEMQKGRTITSVAMELGVSTTLIRIRLNERAKLLQQG